MSPNPATAVAAGDTGTRAALLFALVAERLTAYYEHGQWLKEAQGVTLAAGWLQRSRRTLPTVDLRSLSAASDDLARRIAVSLSREAGLHTAHEMMESLDSNAPTETAQAVMDECTRIVGDLARPS